MADLEELPTNPIGNQNKFKEALDALGDLDDIFVELEKPAHWNWEYVKFQVLKEQDGGYCPYQITGSFTGEGVTKHFYFRGRGSSIRIEVYDTAEDLNEFKNMIFRNDLEYGYGYDAGWITPQMAEYLLGFFIVTYFKSLTK